MPFLSPDWRCPGEKWIKATSSGIAWENAKDWRERVFATMNDVALKRIYRQSIEDDALSPEEFESMLASVVCFQPHIRINLASTREIANVSTITDALLKLDMKSAIRDIRRFNYVCKLVHKLLADRLHTMTGRSQIYIIELLKVIMHQVFGSCSQTQVFRQLLQTLQGNLERHEYDHIGSSQLWANHWDELNKMKTTLGEFDIKRSLTKSNKTGNECAEVPELSLQRYRRLTAAPTGRCLSGLESLPPECLKRIVAHVGSPEDLEAVSRVSRTLARYVDDEVLWRRLATRSFTPNQILAVRCGRASWKEETASETVTLLSDCNWRRAYIRLLKRFGEQQVHSASLGICENCSCLYWLLLGHPCYRPEKAAKVRLLSPEDFIDLFGK